MTMHKAFPDISDALIDVENHPVRIIKALRREFSAFETSVNNQRYNFVAAVVAVYYRLIDDKDDGCKDDFVKIMTDMGNKQASVEKKLLFYLFRYVLKADKKGAMYERARIYYSALNEFAKKRVDPREIPRLIAEANGLEQLYASSRRAASASEPTSETRNPSQPNRISNDIPDGDADEDEDDDDAEKDEDDELEPSAETKPGGSQQGASARRVKVEFDPRTDLAVRFASAEDLFELLGYGDGRGSIRFEMRCEDDKAAHVTAVHWTMERS